MTKTTATNLPEKLDRAIHRDNTRGMIFEVARNGDDAMVLIRWDDGETDTYGAARLYFIKRSGMWLVQD